MFAMLTVVQCTVVRDLLASLERLSLVLPVPVALMFKLSA